MGAATKAKKKTDNIAGTSKDGTAGLFASSYKADKNDDEGWSEVKTKPKAEKQPEETKDDENFVSQKNCRQQRWQTYWKRWGNDCSYQGRIWCRYRYPRTRLRQQSNCQRYSRCRRQRHLPYQGRNWGRCE